MRALSRTRAFAQVSQLAEHRLVHQAFQWLHLRERQFMRWQTDMVSIPAPPFGEGPRAEWLASQFRELGLEQVEIDGAGNALGWYKSPVAPAEERLWRPCILLSAHIDTVFSIDTPIHPTLDGLRLSAPGACDNGAGVVAMLAIAASLVHTRFELPCDLLFAGNVGEEGEGDLRGVRYLYEQPALRKRIDGHIVLDGAGHEAAVTHAVGSRRFVVTVAGPGGHSWSDAGQPNPIVALSRGIARLSALVLGDGPRWTINAGSIEGGTSVNSIPQQASARFDLRSTDAEQLVRLEVELYRAFEDAVLEANRPEQSRERGEQRPAGDRLASPLHLSIAKIGDRPAGHLPVPSQILETLRAVDRHLGIRTEERTASTDANIPLSLGVEAISIGAGGDGGRIHTTHEWYDARGRELGLRRILLLALALAEDTAGTG